jgi:hypothetical protein
MMRADNVACGTSSTGTGTLTLAACPSPPGGLDFYRWLTATGINFVSGNAVLVSYTIIEYTDSTFATVKQTEKGIGTLTLGASLAATTLARTSVQSTVTGMNTSTPSPAFSAPTAIAIGTAANTLVSVGGSSSDLLAYPSVYDVATYGRGCMPLGCVVGTNSSSNALVSDAETYTFFIWPQTMLVKRFVAQVQASYSGGTSNVYARLYAIGSNGKPGKLLIDFGVAGTPGSSLASGNAVIQSAAHATGFLLTPGAYALSIYAAWSGGSGSPTLYGYSGLILPSFLGFDGFAINFGAFPYGYANSATNPAPDPANLVAYQGWGNPNNPVFGFLPS